VIRYIDTDADREFALAVVEDGLVRDDVRIAATGQQNNTRAPTAFHTGYEPDSADELPAAQGHT
jgi:hypothetical protein